MCSEWLEGKDQYHDMRVYVDGSAIATPGQCGAGVVLETVTTVQGDWPKVEQKESFSSFSNNDEAELFALGKGAMMALEQLQECKLPMDQVRTILFTDSTVSMDWTTAKSLRSTAPWPVIHYVRENLTALVQKCRVVICWIRGHKDVAHHNRADELAKAAAAVATEDQCDMKRFKISISALYSKIEADVFREWNEEYARYVPVDPDTKAEYPKCHRTIPSKSMVSLQWGGDYQATLLRALVRLGSYGRVFWQRTGQADDDICQADGCSEVRSFVHEYYNDQLETIAHLVMECTASDRSDLFRFLSALPDASGNMTNLTRWMGCDNTLTLEDNKQIIALLDVYLRRRDAQAGLNPVSSDSDNDSDSGSDSNHSDSEEPFSSSPSSGGALLSEPLKPLIESSTRSFRNVSVMTFSSHVTRKH